MESIVFKFLLFISFFLPFIINFILWPSKRNIIFIQKVPFFVLAYMGGIIFLFDETVEKHSISEINVFLLCVIMLLGSFIYVLSFHIAFKSKVKIKSYLKTLIKDYIVLFDAFYHKYFAKLRIVVLILSVTAIALYVYSYIKMGFVPMFAENPFAAKYFAGEYQERYRPVAQFFRLALNISTIVLPFLFILIFSSRKKHRKIIYMLFFGSIFILTFFSLRRGVIAFPLIYTILLFSVYYKKGKYVLPFVLTYIFIFIFGASFNATFLYFIGLRDNIDLVSIVKGVPDIADLLWFWDSFIKNNYEFSLGRTIYGGLIPYHYDWNPSVVTKLVIGASKNAPTGGFRLPFQVEGYVAFGYIGTVIWSIYYGFINGLYLRLAKYVIYNIKQDFLKFYISVFMINLIFLILSFLIKMQIDKLTIIIISIFILFFIKTRINLIKEKHAT